MRLVDLRCNWLWQYAGEVTTFDPAHYEGFANRIGQIDGYLSGVSAAVLVCNRMPGDWAGRPNRWHALDQLIWRYQAEFSGRILSDPQDAVRWAAEPADGLCWGMLGIGGFDHLIQSEADLDHLPTLFDRGVRVFQPLESAGSLLGGSNNNGDDRGLTELGQYFLDGLRSVAVDASPASPRPILDLAGTNLATFEDILVWFEADSARLDQILLARTDGVVDGPNHPRFRDLIRRFRALGGVTGLGIGEPAVRSSDDLAVSIRALMEVPFRGETGPSGIAIATNALGNQRNSEGLSDLAALEKWLVRTFDKATALAIFSDNARRFLLESIGGAATLD